MGLLPYDLVMGVPIELHELELLFVARLYFSMELFGSKLSSFGQQQALDHLSILYVANGRLGSRL